MYKNADAQQEDDLLAYLNCQGPVEYSPAGVIETLFHCVRFFKEHATQGNLPVLADVTIRRYYNEDLAVVWEQKTQTEVQALEALLEMTGPIIITHMTEDSECWVYTGNASSDVIPPSGVSFSKQMTRYLWAKKRWIGFFLAYWYSRIFHS